MFIINILAFAVDTDVWQSLLCWYPAGFSLPIFHF